MANLAHYADCNITIGSYAGKLELIRSVVQEVECFWLSILPIAANIVDTIYSLCRKFIWPTKHPPILWKTLCRPREDGGMGLKNLGAWNTALLCKTLWKIHMKKNSLWVKWVNHIYSKVDSVWQWNWHREDSPLIKEIIRICDVVTLSIGLVDAAVTRMDNWFSGNAGIRHAYAFFVQSVGRWPWKPLLIKSYLLPKYRFVLWLFAHTKLLTRDRLGHATDKSCVLCDDEFESMGHLFFLCPKAKAVWDGIRDWLGMKKLMGSSTVILRVFRGVYSGNSILNKLRLLACAAAIYHMWNAWNRAMFENETPCVDVMIKNIKIYVLDAYLML